MKGPYDLTWEAWLWLVGAGVVVVLVLFVVLVLRTRREATRPQPAGRSDPWAATDQMAWDLKFDVGDDGKVQVRIRELPDGLLVLSMDLPPDEADRMADALQQQAARSRRRAGDNR